MYRITTFGGVEVHDEDGELQHFRSRKHVALLVYLRSKPRRVHLRENVARLFWETESSLARHSLSQGLYDIRSTLGQVITNVPGDALRVEDDRLAFDVEELERAVKSGDLSTAVDLYTASFAPDLDRAGTDEFERWLERERSRLSVLGQSALRQYLTYADNRGEWGEMCSAALRLIRMNPLDEEAHRALMRGLWLHGDQTSALEHFREVRERLEGELPDGLSERTLELVRRIEGSRPRTSTVDVFADRQIPLVGRQRELEMLARFVEEPASRAESLVIHGEAGIGKTRLVEELEKLLTLEGPEVLKSQCYAAEAEVAYGPILDGLREIAAQIDELPGSASYRELGRLFPSVDGPTGRTSTEAPADGQSARRRLFEEIADMIRRYCRSRSVIWIVEDIHCIDGASSALLHYLARRLAAEPFRLVLTTRPENEQNRSARRLLSEEFFVEHTRTCEVGPLSTSAIAELLEGVAGEDTPDPEVVEKIAQLSGGNPFYAVELARLDADLSADFDAAKLFRGRLKAVLRTRLQGLTSEEVQVLESVAVLGPHASPKHLVEMTGLGWAQVSESCDSLFSRGLLKEEDHCLSFSHEITREFVTKSIGVVTHSALHLQAAELLANNGQATQSTIARHFFLGGDGSRAFEYAVQGAKVAQTRAAFSKAAEMASLALEVAARPDQRIQALEAYVRATRASGLLDDARSGIEQIVSSVRYVADPDTWLRYKFQLVEILVDLADWAAAESSIKEINGKLGGNPDNPSTFAHRLRLDCLHLSIAVRSKADSQVDERASYLQDRLKEAADHNLSATLIAEANYSLAGYAAFYRSASEARDHLLAITNIRDQLSSEHQIKSHLFLGGVYTKLGEWDKAEYNLKSALKLTTSRHDVVNESAVWNNLGCMYLETGDWKDAEVCFDRAVALQDVSGSGLATRLHSDVNLANILFYRGEPRRAYRAYEECLEFLEARGLHSFKPEISACIGLTALQCGSLYTAEKSAEFLQTVTEDQLRGVQERYKIDWFMNYMAQNAKYRVSSTPFSEVENSVQDTDPISALKLRWLKTLIHDTPEEKEDVLSELRSRGLYWFAGFSRRWLKSADGSVKRNQRGIGRISHV